MDTMVCSIFSGVDSEVWASVERLESLEMGEVICPVVNELNPLVVAEEDEGEEDEETLIGSVVEGCKAAGEAAGGGVRAAKGPGAAPPPDGRGILVWEV